MPIEQFLPTLLNRYQSDTERFVYYARGAHDAALSLIQFGRQTAIAPLEAYGPSMRDHTLIHIVTSGRGSLHMAGGVHLVKAGDLFMIPAGCVSYYQADRTDPWSYVWLGFEGAWGDAAMEEAGLSADHPVARLNEFDNLMVILEHMDALMFERDAYLGLMSGALAVLRLLLRAAAVKPDEPGAPADEAALPRVDERLAALVRLLDERYPEPLTVQGLARDLGMSRASLAERFRRLKGCSVKAYITRLRMERACMLLSDSSRSIRSVAESCGYDDPLFFSRVFKRARGLSPSAYRKQTLRR